MKFSVIQDESTVQVDVNRKENTFLLTLDSEIVAVKVLSQNGSDWVVDLGNGPEKMIAVTSGEHTEILFRHQRHVADVFDSRKLALRMMDFVGGNEVVSPMTGRVVSIEAEEGQFVEKGEVVVVVEAMKMENPMKAARGGVVSEICISVGDIVEAKTVLLRLSED